MEKKVVVTVEFEFYPQQNEYLMEHFPNLTDEQLIDKTEKMIDDLCLNAHDGLWWNFQESHIEVNNGKN
jgi:hypothetical protein